MQKIVGGHSGKKKTQKSEEGGKESDYAVKL